MADYCNLVNQLRAAADKGSLLAQFDLANMYLVGVRGLPRDEKIGIQLLKRAARKGYERARSQLATSAPRNPISKWLYVRGWY
jgi:TPR repeat protein